MRGGESVMERGHQRNKKQEGDSEGSGEREKEREIHLEAQALVPITSPYSL